MMIRQLFKIVFISLGLSAPAFSATLAYDSFGEVLHAGGSPIDWTGTTGTRFYAGFTAVASGNMETVSFYANGSHNDPVPPTTDILVTLHTSVWDGEKYIVGDMLESVVAVAPSGGYTTDGLNPDLLSGSSGIGSWINAGKNYWLSFEHIPESGIADTIYFKQNADFPTLQRAWQSYTDTWDGRIGYVTDPNPNGGMQMSVSVSAIPIPAAVWLFGSALAGLGWMRRKQTV